MRFAGNPPNVSQIVSGLVLQNGIISLQEVEKNHHQTSLQVGHNGQSVVRHVEGVLGLGEECVI